jgi:hypothetical protein
MLFGYIFHITGIKTMNEKILFRISISYTGKYKKPNDKPSIMFMNALSKEQAEDAAIKRMKDTLRDNGYVGATFDIITTASSIEEVAFYLKNRDNKSYSAALN